MRSRLLQLTLAAVLPTAFSGCEEDSPVVLETGTARLYPSSPGATGFRWQDIKEAERFVQAARWDFVSASFTYPGVTVDLAATPTGIECDLRSSIQFRDPTVSVVNGACNLGIVIDSLEDPVPATLDVVFRMTVYRARPPQPLERVSTATPEDWDGDGVLNLDDPCPIITGPEFGQEQDVADCSFLSAGGQFQSDQDADGIVDPADNCVWVPNRGQQNTGAGVNTRAGSRVPDGLLIPDGVGDACVRQEAVTQNVEITFDPTDLVQPQHVPSFVVLDFDLATGALACNWDTAECTLDPQTVQYCITTDASVGAFIGCG